MKKLKNILVATDRLSKLSGTETYTYALIEELERRRIYNIEYFTFDRGFLSKRIEDQLDVNFCSRKRYDLILANHNTCVDKLYKKGFIIQTCHGIYPALEQPSLKADGYVAISQEVQSHLALKGLRSSIILNGINLNRFKSNKDLSSNLSTVLSMCHSEKANSLIEQICTQMNIKFTKAYKYKDPVWDVENKINNADLVVALGRSAYEAMACGRPVIVYDDRGYFKPYGDGYVKNILEFSIQYNCSGRYSKKIYEKDDLSLEFEKYSSNDSTFFRDFAKKELDIKKQVDHYLNFYFSLRKNGQHSYLKNILKNFRW